MFNNKYKNDDFEDLRRQEAYEREKEIRFARGIGNIFVKVIVYGMILFFSYLSIATALGFFFELDVLVSFTIGLVSAIFILRLEYVRAYPFKSLGMILFLLSLQYFMVGGLIV